MTLLADHLWQSTLFAIGAAILTRALRRNRAQVRHGIWLAASIKFLVPFAALVAFGRQFAWWSPVAANVSSAAEIVEIVSQPFSQPAVIDAAALPVAPFPSVPAILAAILLSAWAVGFFAILALWLVRWRRVALTLRQGTVVEGGRIGAILRQLDGGRLRVVSSDTVLEPGVFGIRRPLLLWPASMTARLTDHQIAAILAHELAHVRRRDNLAAAIHMLVQAVFWFHPLVWWLGARLIDERERACDEAVIEQGSEPQVYAESLLRTCELYLESPLACVAGVTGSDLTKRIAHIMRGEPGITLGGSRRAALIAMAMASIIAPITVGALEPSASADSTAGIMPGTVFDATFVKRSDAGHAQVGLTLQPDGRFHAINVTLRMLINTAYGEPFRPLVNVQVEGGPEWIDTDRFDIIGLAAPDVDRGPNGPLASMLRTLLADRFGLVAHKQQKQLLRYALTVVGASDPELRKAEADCGLRPAGSAPPPPPPPPLPDGRPRCGIQLLRGSLSAGGVTMAQLANAISRLTNQMIVDRTGLGGRFDLDLIWDDSAPARERFATIVAAMEQQLGLTMAREVGPVEVLSIDRVRRPTVYDEFVTMPIQAPPPPPPPPARGEG